MHKKKLLDMIAKKEARKKELSEKAKTSQDVAELRSINAEMESLNGDIAELRGMADSIPEEPVPAVPPVASGDEGKRSKEVEDAEARRAGAQKLNPLAAIRIGTGTSATDPDKRGFDDVLKMATDTPEQKAEMRHALFSAPEYRSGYFKMLAGRKDFTDVEKRALTTASDSGGAAVPTTTFNMIIQRMQQTSALFGLLKPTYLPGNVVLPVANAQTAAEWTDEAPATDKDDTLTSVSLTAYALSKFAKVKGQLILMAIDALETYIVRAIGDQLAIAVENAILNGTGTKQPTGILTGVAWTDGKNSATFTDKLDYDNMVDAKKMLGLYRSNAVWVVNAAMEAAIYKIKTTVNQPLFTQNPITGLISNPLGFPLVVDYYMPDDTILLFNPDYYFMNINQNPMIEANDSAGFMTTSRVFRGTLFADAKPTLSEAFVKMTKATAGG